MQQKINIKPKRNSTTDKASDAPDTSQKQSRTLSYYFQNEKNTEQLIKGFKMHKFVL